MEKARKQVYDDYKKSSLIQLAECLCTLNMTQIGTKLNVLFNYIPKDPSSYVCLEQKK